MIRRIWYEAIDPYYNDELQTFIGTSHDDLDAQEYEHDKFLGRYNPAGIMFLFDKHVVYESDCEDWEAEFHEANYKRYIEKRKVNK